VDIGEGYSVGGNRKNYAYIYQWENYKDKSYLRRYFMGLWKNTVRISAQFLTFDGDLADPSSISLTVIDKNTGTTLVNVSGSDISRKAVGEYYYNYTLPPSYGTLICEYVGMLEGYPIVNRINLEKEFLKSWHYFWYVVIYS
jgi:hypothetical protein